jgi:hypothetical protein
MRAGTTAYFGVNVPGGQLSLGDGHCRQGEGEVCGTAVEAAMRTVVVVDLIKGGGPTWPRIESDEFNGLRHAILPILGALAFIPAFFAGAGIPAFSFITSLPRPLWYAGPIAAIWMVIGIVYLVWLNARDPRRILETKRVFDEE